MKIPRFHDENIAPEMMISKSGEAFQNFVAELFCEDHIDMSVFTAGGKDGAIDHTLYLPDGTCVIECKHIQDGLDIAKKCWQKVSDKLRRNITSPDSPPKRQGQYRPWYNPKKPISHYLFCFTGELSNENQIQELESVIETFFKSLSSNLPHLSHLSGIVVECWPWNRLASKAQNNPSLCFRWFPSCRPSGLSMLRDHLSSGGGFRAYLDENTLPYLPLEGKGFEPIELLTALSSPDRFGLIITGIGGIGKTRLVLEIGREALGKEWIVLKANKSCRAESIDQLAQQVAPNQQVVVLFDYVEVHRDFDGIIERINTYNTEHGYSFQYVANCRSNYYTSIRAIERHTEVNLSPGGRQAHIFQIYRESVVQHILRYSQVSEPEAYLRICKGIPILAVFISYLNAEGRQRDLLSLRGEQSFVEWIRKRLHLSFPGRDTQILSTELCSLLVQYPMDSTASDYLADSDEKLWLLHNQLVNDGWVQKNTYGDYISAHDLFVDQLVSDHLTHSQDNESDIRRGLILAEKLDCLRSLLISYLRIAEEVCHLDWPRLITERINKQPELWHEVREILAISPLLTPETIILHIPFDSGH
jgi:hypothetical protein